MGKVARIIKNKNMKTTWKVLAWIFVACGILAYLSAWGNMWFGWSLWGVAPEYLFYDAIATGIFALFFLVWGKLSTEH